MKLFILKLTLFFVSILTIFNQKLKNETLSKRKNYLKTNNYNNSTNISNSNLMLLKKYTEIKKKTSSRITSNDFNSEYADKEFISGNCLVKYKGYIINLYPFSERAGGSFFLRYKTDVYDFDICKNIFTHTGRYGLFVDRYKDVVLAGDSEIEKYFTIDIEEKEKKKNEEYKENENDKTIKKLNLNRVKENSKKLINQEII